MKSLSMTNQSNTLKYNDERHFPFWIAVSISGPSLSSWSIVLEKDLPLNEAVEKLNEFKESIDLKSKTTAYSFFSS